MRLAGALVLMEKREAERRLGVGRGGVQAVRGMQECSQPLSDLASFLLRCIEKVTNR